jgi:uncharacterized membrane protein YhfC
MQMNLLFMAHALNGFLMIGMPIALGMYLTRKFHYGWRLWFIGAAGFIISQVGHIPFNIFINNLFLKGSLPMPPPVYRSLILAIIAGLSAGIFEEGTRYLVMRFWAKDACSWRKGILLGAGHGGAEAILLGGLVFYAFIQMAAYQGADLSKLVPASQLAAAQQQITAYWSATWYDSLLGAVERLFTIPVQICFGVIVVQVFTRKRIYWLGAAVLWHTVIDASTVFVNGYLKSFAWGTYAVEGMIGLMSLVSIGIIFALRQAEPVEPEATLSGPLEPLSPTPKEVEETPENLDNSRFN